MRAVCPHLLLIKQTNETFVFYRQKSEQTENPAKIQIFVCCPEFLRILWIFRCDDNITTLYPSSPKPKFQKNLWPKLCTNPDNVITPYFEITFVV